ncbi:uncharacterized protein LOC129566156 [Sitodiplosis mosellana]|uniref:uncharacterized protein LOC129566156 n=1 Tax=Sitodiplosis mosellana TaxID=263140 RepID=UPI0024437A40|nr:uncharacterized protein LOC129566156 [Sitodiplosis mosellana]
MKLRPRNPKNHQAITLQKLKRDDKWSKVLNKWKKDCPDIFNCRVLLKHLPGSKTTNEEMFRMKKFQHQVVSGNEKEPDFESSDGSELESKLDQNLLDSDIATISFSIQRGISQFAHFVCKLLFYVFLFILLLIIVIQHLY